MQALIIWTLDIPANRQWSKDIPLKRQLRLITMATMGRRSSLNLHIWIVKHHVYNNTEAICIHLVSPLDIKNLVSTRHQFIHLDYKVARSWKAFTWYFHGFCSCIWMQRKPEVRLSPINSVWSGKRLRSIPRPQSTRLSPWKIKLW